jgi:single-strand DNA-binding protein
MASTFNTITLLGHLSREPELRATTSGTAITIFALATNHRYKTGDTVHEETCFLDVMVFGRQAEVVHTYLSKGSHVLVEGRVRQHTWEGTDGQKRTKHEVVADRVHFLGPRAPGAHAPLTPGATDEAMADEVADEEEDIPFGRADFDDDRHERYPHGTPGGRRKPAKPRRAPLT